MPLISIPIDDASLTVSSVFLGVASSAITGALGVRAGLAITLGAAIGLISYAIGVIPIGFLITLAFLAVGASFRKIFSSQCSKSENAANNHPIEKKNLQFSPILMALSICIFTVFIVLFSDKTGNRNANSVVQANYSTSSVSNTDDQYDLAMRAMSKKLSEADGYRFGTPGIQKNYGKAIEVYYALISDGHENKEAQDLAALRLAEMIYEGVGFKKNIKQSIEWYEFLIRRNAPYSLPAYRLGSIYEKGEEVPQNIVFAYCYYNLSASSKKLEYLSEIPDHIKTGKGSFGIQVAKEISADRRDQLEKSMTNDQVRQAQALKQCGVVH